MCSSDLIKVRMDLKEGFDEEVLVLEDIPPENIECLYIFSDHEMMTINQWNNVFATFTEAVCKPIGSIVH